MPLTQKHHTASNLDEIKNHRSKNLDMEPSLSHLKNARMDEFVHRSAGRHSVENFLTKFKNTVNECTICNALWYILLGLGTKFTSTGRLNINTYTFKNKNLKNRKLKRKRKEKRKRGSLREGREGPLRRCPHRFRFRFRFRFNLRFHFDFVSVFVFVSFPPFILATDLKYLALGL